MRTRVRGPWGRSGPLVRITSAVSRSMAQIWRRSLQLRVVVLTLGLSAVVILALGFVLTSQITNRVLEVKVKAATEEIATGARHRQRDRQRRGGSVAGLQPATGPQHPDLQNGADLRCGPGRHLRRGADGARRRSAGGRRRRARSTRFRARCAGSSRPARSATSTKPCAPKDTFAGPALLVGTPAPSRVTNLELYLIFPLTSEENTITLVRGTMVTGGLVLLVLLAGIAMLVSRQVVLPVRSASRIAERFAEGHLSERMPVRGEDDMARLAIVVQRYGRKPAAPDHQPGGVRKPAAPLHLRRQPRAAVRR